MPLQALQPRAELVVAEAFDFGAVVPGAGIGEFFPYVSVALETAPISAQ